MADPLSIAAGVIGILTAAAQVSHLLIDFTKNSKNAPQTARTVLTEVNEISGTLTHLQSFLLGSKAVDSSRTRLLLVDHVVTVVSGCLLTFSELESLMDTLKTEDMEIRDCVRWAKNEKSICSLVLRLQNHKASLSLVLLILNGDTILEAKNSVDRLHDMIERFYGEITSRIDALELQSHPVSDELVTSGTDVDEDRSSIITVFGPSNKAFIPNLDQTSSTAKDDPDYMQTLQESWSPKKRYQTAMEGSCGGNAKE
ncbi:MAG: hypothetical protein Q9168_002638 [Polycauliona sp. 1 TL-2023]